LGVLRPPKKTGLSASSPRICRRKSCGLSATIPCAAAAQNLATELPLAICCVQPGGGNLRKQIAYKGSSKNFHFMIFISKGKNCCGNSNFFLCVISAMGSF
jgi:hypothetical protein